MKMKLKKKKKIKVIYILFLILIYVLSFSLTIKFYFYKKDNTEILRYFINNNKKKKFLTIIINTILDIDFNNSLSLINNNFKYYNKTSSDEDKSIEVINISSNINTKDELDIKKPIVYIYNTHQSEEYTSSNSNDYNVKPTVLLASYIIRENLNKNNIPTIVEENNISEYLKKNNLKYKESYKVSRLYMEQAKENNDSLIYFVDIHRDSVNKNISTVEINGKKYAKILFIVGLENNNYQENLEVTEKLDQMFKDKYPNISRGIYKKKGAGVNGVYNQDFSNRTILIEVGGEENTIDEVNNTCEAISDILTEYIRSDNYEK